MLCWKGTGGAASAVSGVLLSYWFLSLLLHMELVTVTGQLMMLDVRKLLVDFCI